MRPVKYSLTEPSLQPPDLPFLKETYKIIIPSHFFLSALVAIALGSVVCRLSNLLLRDTGMLIVDLKVSLGLVAVSRYFQARDKNLQSLKKKKEFAKLLVTHWSLSHRDHFIPRIPCLPTSVGFTYMLHDINSFFFHQNFDTSIICLRCRELFSLDDSLIGLLLVLNWLLKFKCMLGLEGFLFCFVLSCFTFMYIGVLTACLCRPE